MNTDRPHKVESSLSDLEYEVFTKLCLARGMSEDALLRQCLRVYQHIDRQRKDGYESFVFLKEDGTQVEESLFSFRLRKD